MFVGLVTAWRLAGVPTRSSPLGLNATTDGVVRAPSAFSMTFGFYINIKLLDPERSSSSSLKMIICFIHYDSVTM